jgi:hypothetical protein
MKYIKKIYLVLAILFSIAVVFDFFVLFSAWYNGVLLHSQIQQHFYINPPMMFFSWYMALKEYR